MQSTGPDGTNRNPQVARELEETVNPFPFTSKADCTWKSKWISSASRRKGGGSALQSRSPCFCTRAFFCYSPSIAPQRKSREESRPLASSRYSGRRHSRHRSSSRHPGLRSSSRSPSMHPFRMQTAGRVCRARRETSPRADPERVGSMFQERPQSLHRADLTGNRSQDLSILLPHHGTRSNRQRKLYRRRQPFRLR